MSPLVLKEMLDHWSKILNLAAIGSYFMNTTLNLVTVNITTYILPDMRKHVVQLHLV